MDGYGTTVLLVLGEESGDTAVAHELDARGYKRMVAVTEKEALDAIAQGVPDIVLFDIDLPDMGGTDAIAKVRTWSKMPILVVSSHDDDPHKIAALDAGADDYLHKPFSLGELMARIRMTERHLSYIDRAEMLGNATFANGDLYIDFVAGSVSLGGRELHLTPREYKLLCLMARNVGSVLTHQRILREVWGASQETDLATLRVFMGTLRKKVEIDPSSPRYIQTHVGVGYGMTRVTDA